MDQKSFDANFFKIYIVNKFSEINKLFLFFIIVGQYFEFKNNPYDSNKYD